MLIEEVRIDPPALHQSIITLEYKGPTDTKSSKLILRWGCEKHSMSLDYQFSMTQQAIRYLATRSITVLNDLYLPENFVQKHCKNLGNVWLLIVEHPSEASLS
jgi:hypothetical protein